MEWGRDPGSSPVRDASTWEVGRGICLLPSLGDFVSQVCFAAVTHSGYSGQTDITLVSQSAHGVRKWCADLAWCSQ